MYFEGLYSLLSPLFFEGIYFWRHIHFWMSSISNIYNKYDLYVWITWMSKLPRNAVNVKQPALKKKSNYLLLQIVEKCFQYITCFAWIKVISVLLYLKYWYYNTPYLNSRFSILDSSFPVILALSVKFHPGRLKSLFNTIFFMIFIGFPTLSYLYDHAQH